jgi:hypothetical protein
MKPAVSPHEARICWVARWAFVYVRGETDEQKRERDIAALPVVDWKGKRLVALATHGREVVPVPVPSRFDTLAAQHAELVEDIEREVRRIDPPIDGSTRHIARADVLALLARYREAKEGA